MGKEMKGAFKRQFPEEFRNAYIYRVGPEVADMVNDPDEQFAQEVRRRLVKHAQIMAVKLGYSQFALFALYGSRKLPLLVGSV